MAEAVAGVRSTPRRAGAFLIVIGFAAVLFSAFAPTAGADHVPPDGPATDPIFIEHGKPEQGLPNPRSENPKCADFDDAFGQTWVEVKTGDGNPDPGSTGTITITDANVKILITTTTGSGGQAKVVTFESVDPDDGGPKVAQAIDAVVIKAGDDGHHLYVYDPEIFHDDGLTSPGTGNAISHISFCYDVGSTTTSTTATSTTSTSTTSTSTTSTSTTTTTIQRTTTTQGSSCCFVAPTTTTTQAPTTTVAPTTTTAQVLGTSIVPTTAAPTTTAAPATTGAIVKGVTLARTGTESRTMVLLAGLALVLGGAAMVASDKVVAGRAK